MLSRCMHRFDAVPHSLPALRQLIADQSRRHGWDDRCLDMTIAIGEVVQNIIRHGFADGSQTNSYFWIDVEYRAPHLVWTIADNAPPSQPQNWPRQTAFSDGGYGLGLVSAVAAHVDFMPVEGGNMARLWFARNRNDA